MSGSYGSLWNPWEFCEFPSKTCGPQIKHHYYHLSWFCKTCPVFSLYPQKLFFFSFGMFCSFFTTLAFLSIANNCFEKCKNRNMIFKIHFQISEFFFFWNLTFRRCFQKRNSTVILDIHQEILHSHKFSNKRYPISCVASQIFDGILQTR